MDKLDKLSENHSLFKSFIETNIQSLIQIYISERTTRGEGILMITRKKSDNGNSNDDKMDVVYLTGEQMPQELLQDLLNKKKDNHRPSIIYFYVCMSEDNSDSFWIEYDLDNRN